jgi:hypothetical protein
MHSLRMLDCEHSRNASKLRRLQQSRRFSSIIEGPVEDWRSYVEPIVIELIDRGSPIGARFFERAVRIGKTLPFELYGKPYDALLGQLASDAAAPLSIRERAVARRSVSVHRTSIVLGRAQFSSLMAGKVSGR